MLPQNTPNERSLKVKYKKYTRFYMVKWNNLLSSVLKNEYILCQGK